MLAAHRQVDAVKVVVNALEQQQLLPIIQYCVSNFPNLTSTSTDHHTIFAMAMRNTLNEQLEKDAFVCIFFPLRNYVVCFSMYLLFIFIFPFHYSSRMQQKLQK